MARCTRGLVMMLPNPLGGEGGGSTSEEKSTYSSWVKAGCYCSVTTELHTPGNGTKAYSMKPDLDALVIYIIIPNAFNLANRHRFAKSH